MFFVFCIYSESISISDVGAGGGATCENGGNRASVTSAGLLDAGAGTSNPLPKILMNSSIPRTIMVSAYPRCPWHRGHCFTRPSSPLYHSSTQCWHPIKRLQHFPRIAGGTSGQLRQIVHLKFQ